MIKKTEKAILPNGVTYELSTTWVKDMDYQHKLSKGSHTAKTEDDTEKSTWDTNGTQDKRTEKTQNQSYKTIRTHIIYTTFIL